MFKGEKKPLAEIHKHYLRQNQRHLAAFQRPFRNFSKESPQMKAQLMLVPEKLKSKELVY